MGNIMRFDPFVLNDTFDDLFKGLMLRPMRAEMRTAPQLRMDVTETDQVYTVRAEIPGVSKDDINVSIDGNQVSISAEVKKEKDIKEGETVLRSERSYGQAVRSFTLVQEVDDSKSQAKYSNGVLELTLPKKAYAQAKKLEIL